MVELIALILIVIALFKYSGTINKSAKVLEESTNAKVDPQLFEYAVQRQELARKVKKYKEENNIDEFTTDEELMKELGID